MKKWEYKVEYLPTAPLDTLNKLGNDGWELVAINHDMGFFKREKVYDPAKDGPFIEVDGDSRDSDESARRASRNSNFRGGRL